MLNHARLMNYETCGRESVRWCIVKSFLEDDRHLQGQSLVSCGLEKIARQVNPPNYGQPMAREIFTHPFNCESSIKVIQKRCFHAILSLPPLTI